MTAIRGRVVQTPGRKNPYKVVLEHEGREESEHPVSTMREGEALIKDKMPRAPQRIRSREHDG